MSPTFPTTKKSVTGYSIDDVERFLAAARTAFDSDRAQRGTLTSREIRRTAFPLARGGYSIGHVDAAMTRLEDAFAMREKEVAIALGREAEVLAEARAAAQSVLDRLARGPRRRFRRAGLLGEGYDVREVDAFSERLIGYFRSGTMLSADDVRSASFRVKTNGYSERQVDELLDVVIEAMLLVR